MVNKEGSETIFSQMLHMRMQESQTHAVIILYNIIYKYCITCLFSTKLLYFKGLVIRLFSVSLFVLNQRCIDECF